MSLAYLRAAFQLPVTGAKKAVLLALADHANDAGECFPSIGRLALFAGVTDRAVTKALRELEQANILRTAYVTGNRSQYQLILTRNYADPTASDGSAQATPERGSPLSDHGPPNEVHLPPNEIHHPPERGSPKPSLTVITTASEPSILGGSSEDGPLPAATKSQKAGQSSEQKSRKSRVPSHWRPDQKDIDFAVAKGMTDIATEVEHFIAHHEAKGTLSSNWSANWRTWAINAQRFRLEREQRFPSRNQNTAPQHSGGVMSVLQRRFANLGD